MHRNCWHLGPPGKEMEMKLPGRVCIIKYLYSTSVGPGIWRAEQRRDVGPSEGDTSVQRGDDRVYGGQGEW